MTAVETSSHSFTSPEQHAIAPELEFSGPCGQRYFFYVVTNPLELLPFQQAWQELADRTTDPNPFYEPWFFLPAAKHFGQDQQWRILLVYAEDLKRTGSRELCGFFPFTKAVNLFFSSRWTLWKNSFCYLTSPLIDRNRVAPVLRAVAHFLRQFPEGPACMEFPMMAGEGALYHGFTEILRENLSTTFTPDQYLRAITTCHRDVDDYLKHALGGHHMREYRRKRRKLDAIGQLEYRSMQDPRLADCWTNWFLDLEAQGWKARAGTAIKQHADQAQFFREMIQNGLQAQKVQIEGLFLNGEPIALKCILFAKPAAFAFKIAFDESHSNCSPGVQLEFESLQRLADDKEVAWCDSCAIPGHQMIDRIWLERRVVRHLIVSTGRVTGDVLIGSLPLFRALNRVRKRWGETQGAKS